MTVRDTEHQMADPLLKVHGAIADGWISHDDDGRWRAFLLVRDLGKDLKQEPVGWVERSETHHLSKMSPPKRWVSLRSTCPTGQQGLTVLVLAAL
jgi:hypothetical protein